MGGNKKIEESGVKPSPVLRRWWVHGDVRHDGKTYYCRRCDGDVAVADFDEHVPMHHGQWPDGREFSRLRRLEARSDFVLVDRMLEIFERLRLAGTHFRPAHTRNLFVELLREGGGYGANSPLG